MQIVLDTSTASDRDVELLAAFVRVMQGEPAAEQVTNARPKRQPGSRAKSTTATVAEPAQEPPSEAATQDVEPVSEGAPPPPPAGSQKEAVAFVTKQVADGKARRIKMALEKQGVARLSELSNDSLGEFMENAQLLCKLSPEEFKKLDEAG